MLLLACPSCHRQYDVTAHEPGSRVRCVCEELLDVGWPKQLSGQALACTHCGGAVAVEDQSCPYCNAAISEADRRKTTLCPACFTRIEDDSKHCRACAVEIRPQALTPLPKDRDCPRCGESLRARALSHGNVIECGACLGLWLTPEAFDRTLRESERESAIEALALEPSPAPASRELEQVQYIPCLSCGELMNRRLYRYAERSSGVVIDACRHHGVWLDHQELERIVAFVKAGGAGGRRHVLPDPAAFAPARRERDTQSREKRYSWGQSWLIDLLLTIFTSPL
jgi:Zn-finger nucleic acid-binding protein